MKHAMRTGYQGVCKLAFFNKHTVRALLHAGVIAVCLAGIGTLHAQNKMPAPEPGQLPHYRHIDPSAPAPDLKAWPIIRFATVGDFPPFSFTDKSGALTGFNIAIASTLCRVLRVECRFGVSTFEGARKDVEEGRADVLLTGLSENSTSGQSLSFTRPYFRFSARFAVRRATPMSKADPRTLAGKRIGVITGTAHEVFLLKYFSRSKIRGFSTSKEANEALRTGVVDALFDDAVKLMFWLNGSASRGCCRFTGDAYVDPAGFSRPLSMAVKAGNKPLLVLLDHGLDRLQISGRFEKIFSQYFPASPWKGN